MLDNIYYAMYATNAEAAVEAVEAARAAPAAPVPIPALAGPVVPQNIVNAENTIQNVAGTTGNDVIGRTFHFKYQQINHLRQF